MKLTDWLNQPNKENEILDVFLQIALLARDGENRGGLLSPTLYSVDAFNNVSFFKDLDVLEASLNSEISEISETGEVPENLEVGEIGENFKTFENGEDFKIEEASKKAEISEAEDALRYNFRAPETNVKSVEKRDVFSLGMFLYFLLNNETYYKKSGVSFNSFLKPRRLNSKSRNSDLSVIKAQDSKPLSRFLERMTRIEPDARPLLKDVLGFLYSNICRFSICPKNVATGEVFPEITRSFTGSASFKFIPEKEYVINNVTLSPVTQNPVVVPFRLVKKVYELDVVYSKTGRWSRAVKKAYIPPMPSASREEAEKVPLSQAAIYYADAVYESNTENAYLLALGTDGYTYEIAYSDCKDKRTIDLTATGSLSVPERIEARILSLMKQAGQSGQSLKDAGRVAVYGTPSPRMIKTINDLFPEEVNIYPLSEDDIVKGAALRVADTGEAEALTLEDEEAESLNDELTENSGEEAQELSQELSEDLSDEARDLIEKANFKY